MSPISDFPPPIAMLDIPPPILQCSIFHPIEIRNPSKLYQHDNNLLPLVLSTLEHLLISRPVDELLSRCLFRTHALRACLQGGCSLAKPHQGCCVTQKVIRFCRVLIKVARLHMQVPCQALIPCNATNGDGQDPGKPEPKMGDSIRSRHND